MAWTIQPNGKMRNDAVAADASAIHRGGALDVDNTTMGQELFPWADADNDQVNLDFILPGAITGVQVTPVGWEGVVQGSDLGNGLWGCGVADLDGVKGVGGVGNALDDFLMPGAQSYLRIPKGDVPASGEWRPAQKQLSGNWDDFWFEYQPDVRGDPNTSYQPEWHIGSLTIFHKSKFNDHVDFPGVGNYGFGIASRLARPMAVGFRSNGTTVTGWVFGEWEVNGLTGVLTKVFSPAAIAEINSWSAQTATVVVDDILGWSGVGAIAGGLPGTWLISHAASTVAAGDITDVNLYLQILNNSAWTETIDFATYESSGGRPDGQSKIASTDAAIVTSNTDGYFLGWKQTAFAGASLGAGDYCLAMRTDAASGGDNQVARESFTAGTYYWQPDFTSGLPATFPASDVVEYNFRYSFYATVEASTSPPVTTNAAVDPSSVAQGVSSALSADITDADHTIDEAEYFIGADPGEGAGTDMDLGAGTTSREATKTITGLITAGLAVDDHTVSVRGHDATDGWGAVDTVVLTVTEAVVATGGMLSGLGVGKVGGMLG